VSRDTHLQIAIDGPAASGKTTVARATARRLNALYLDTGAMYRALAYLALRTGTDVDNGAALARLRRRLNQSKCVWIGRLR
jgi:cytidylate kinase